MLIKSYEFDIKEATCTEQQGMIKGFASTFGNIDLDGDIILPGAFTKSLSKYKDSGRMIPMLFSHKSDEPIGGFDPNRMFQTDKGLEVEGQLDLETQRGREVYSLARKKFLGGFSVGFSVKEGDYEYVKGRGKNFKNLLLHEISMTPVPANTEAVFTEVKAATPHKDLPIAPDDTPWSAQEAINDIKKATGSDKEPSKSYKNYFMWYDQDNADKFSSYKLPYAKDVGGELKAVPKALAAIAGAINGARGGVDIPDSDKSKVKSNVDKYYKKMGKDSPFSDSKSLVKSIEYWQMIINLKMVGVDK